MIRAQLMRRRQEEREIRDGFRMRGAEITRLEGFTDTVFGFAVTLLVVSLEVPTDVPTLLDNMKDLLPFAVCFATLCYLWYRHYIFFRRYGLNDATMTVLNSALLFVILAYVYPLKFVFRLFLDTAIFHEHIKGVSSDDQFAALFVIYGIGFAAVYVMFAAFHVHAYRQRKTLDLTPIEELITRSGIYGNLGVAAIGVLCAILAAAHLGLDWGLPGWVFFLIAPIMTIFGRWEGKQHRALSARLAEQGGVPETSAQSQS